MGVAFVTGASGFIGRHLVRALIDRGDQVRGLARSQRSADVVTSPGAVPIVGGLHDHAALTDGMHGADAVYHLAARVEEWGAAADFERDNVDATTQVVVAARRCGVPRLVLVSSERVQLASVPVEVPSRCLGRRPAGVAATASEAIWRRLHLPGTPPLTWAAISVVGQTCTVDASKARRVLRYAPSVDRDQGSQRLASTGPSSRRARRSKAPTALRPGDVVESTEGRAALPPMTREEAQAAARQPARSRPT